MPVEMLVEMSPEEMGKYVRAHPENMPIDIGLKYHGWRSFAIDEYEISRLLILKSNLASDGSENYKNLHYISGKTGIPADAIDYYILHNEVLTVIPISTPLLTI